MTVSTEFCGRGSKNSLYLLCMHNTCKICLFFGIKKNCPKFTNY